MACDLSRQFRPCACGHHAWAPLTRGFVGLCDIANAELLSRWTWHAKKNKRRFYVARSEHVVADGRRRSTSIAAHRVIFPLLPPLLVDHANGNGLDNRLENLRAATFTQNAINKVRKSRAICAFRGVVRNKLRFHARITVDRQLIYLGSFKSQEAAAAAYDTAAKSAFGEFARLNAEASL